MTEARRRDLEAYLRAIEAANDGRWRHTSAWRTFLQLGTQRLSAASDNHKGNEPGSRGLGIKDPATWLAVHQDLKANLHQARLALTRREQAQTAQQQHEAGAAAKKYLVLAGTLIAALDAGLKTLAGNTGGKGGTGDVAVEKLGDGELRRRRDLVSGARKEKEGLEGVLGALAVKTLAAGGSGAGASASTLSSSGAAATPADKAHLFRVNGGGSSTSLSSKRTLGAPAAETQRTRELDNQGVVQLQRQIMHEQDEDVADLGKAIRRMREMGVQINDELQLQNDLLRLMDDDVDRVGGKIDVAKKRIAKIR